MRILVNTEASYLSTGYATYGRDLIQGLLEAGHDVAEISCYGQADDPRRAEIPWKNYPIAPCKGDEQKIHEIYHSNPANQFGAWRLERICLDFKPDCILSQKDFWMEAFIQASPYRSIFKWIWAATCDAAPQNEEWINGFANTDYYYSLSDWGGDVVQRQGNVNYMGSVTSAAPREMVPVPNKFAHKLAMGINPDWNIIGTVMRNQRRKLFPDLFEAFAALNRTDTYLYCHTSYPDNGWDFPKLLCNYGIANKVLFTYVCSNCKAFHAALFGDALKQCKKCKQYTCKPASVSNGLSNEDLAKIYNVFDVYVQLANSEGQGLGQLEAAACGVPIMATDYSAMEDICRKVDGYPIPLLTKHLELETGCYRAIPDNRATAAYFREFFELSPDQRSELGQKAREAYLRAYSWDRIIKKWLVSIEACPKANWGRPIRQVRIPETTPEFRTNKEFLDWAANTYLPHFNLINSYELSCMLRDLNFGQYKPNPCGYFYSENSYFDRGASRPFTRDDVTKLFKHKAEMFNFWERARVGQITFPQENWL
jgi:glycosyltransferase involved in cell wall biosynthesis